METLEIVLLAVLLIVNGFLATARSALINVRKARLKQLGEEGVGRALTAERVAEDSSRLLATTRLGMMLTSMFAGAAVAVFHGSSLATVLEPALGFAAAPLAYVLLVLVTALVMLVLGELVPEALGVQHSERLALWLARPVLVLEFLCMPVVSLIIRVSNALSRLLGASAQRGMPMVTEEEIKTLVDAGEEEGVIQEEEKEMIYSIFELGDTLTREVMVPRIDIVSLDVTTPLLEALDAVMAAGHSRIPVYEETIDNVAGVLYAKDLLPFLRDGQTDVPLRTVLREAYFIPETKKASDLLPDLQQRRVHMAIVVDEYGGTAGLVTIEDLLEEIVGEIQDEYDTEDPFFEFINDDEYVFNARVDLDDLNRLMSVALPTEDNDTLGGFIYTELGKVPVVGNTVAFADLSFTVESVVGRRIKKVRVKRHPPFSSQEQGEAGEAVTTGHGDEAGSTNGRRRWPL